MKNFLYSLVLLLLLGGCVAWSQVGGPYTNGSGSYSVELPSIWMKLNNTDALVITRDGLLLQNIIINQFDITEKPDETVKKKKQITAGMLPQEIAEVLIDNFSSDPSTLNFELISNGPVQISGQPGTKIVYRYKTKDGLRIKCIHYSCLKGIWLYNIRYSAAERYYFDKDVSTFQSLMSSFRIIKS